MLSTEEKVIAQWSNKSFKAPSLSATARGYGGFKGLLGNYSASREKKVVKTVIADVFYNTYQKTSFNINNLLIRSKTTKPPQFCFQGIFYSQCTSNSSFHPTLYTFAPPCYLPTHPSSPYMHQCTLLSARILVLNALPRSLCLKVWSLVSDTIRRWWGLSVVGHREDFPMARNIFAEEDCGALVSLYSLLLPRLGEWFCSAMSPHNDALVGAKTMVAINH